MNEPDKKNLKVVRIDKILSHAVKAGASDVHLKVGYRPTLRLHGQIVPIETEVIDSNSIEKIIEGIFSETQRDYFRKMRNVDASLERPDSENRSHRYRVNAAYDMKGPYVTIRVIPDTIRDAREIGFPNDVWEDVIQLKRGMVLVTGITGSGKTTTLASLIQEINRTRADHIITIEDPVEYVHCPIKSIISQREIGAHVKTFADGVKYSLRQDPDVLLIGEIRDRETAYRALEAAATGHLVFSTLHTTSAAETARRFVNIFETEDHENIRNSLAANLAYVLSQQLIPYQKEVGRTLAMEVMDVQGSPAIKNHLRKGEYHVIGNELQSGKAQKMITMDQHLMQLCEVGRISEENAILYAQSPEQMKSKFGQ